MGKKKKKKKKKVIEEKKQKIEDTENNNTESNIETKKEKVIESKTKKEDDNDNDNDNDIDREDEKEEISGTDYNDSDDEMWCETTESYDEDDIVPAFLFGQENEADNLEDLETALFCEYIENDDDN